MAIDENGLMRLALTGKMRSGKSTIAHHLWLMYDLEILSFGTALKRVAEELFGDTGEYKYEKIYADCPFSDGGKRVVGRRKPRRLYQDVGQKLRELDENVWIRQLEREMDVKLDSRSTRGIVIDDLRQPNEYEWARENGFTIIRVDANEDTRLERANAEGDDFTAEDLRHDTEQYVDDFEVDYEITNDGSNADLLARVDEIVSGLIK